MGINTALTEYGFSYALSNGFEYCETDWRSTKMIASSFWPGRGFKPFAFLSQNNYVHKYIVI